MTEIASKCFISYHRPDNTDFLSVVDRLKSELGGRFNAQTGRSLEIFLDRDSIGWGADWRQEIRESVLGAAVFMPVITMRFFQSDACREELSAYYENARELGVTELIVPIVLAGASRITPDHPDELVQLIERLNYISIEAEWATGYESSAWIGAINRMIENLASHLDAAEVVLSEREVERASSLAPSDTPEESAADLEALNELVTDVTASLTNANEAMANLSSVLTQVTEDTAAETSPQAKRAKQLRGAMQIKDAAESFAITASEMEGGVAAADVQLRSVVFELRDIGNPESLQSLERLLTPLGNFPDQLPSQTVIDEAIAGLRLASLGNVSTRRALEPALRGMQSMRAGMGTARTWATL
ncbi:toll/interleukin-1 receptor domain-containing protein [Rhodoglobus sp.]